MTNYIIKNKNISVREIFGIFNFSKKISLSKSIISKINKSRIFLEKKINESNKPFYGINTGFGDLHNIKINDKNLSLLQNNLIKSHACGTGEKVDSNIVKLMMLLKIISLSKGYSGIRFETVERLLFFYNNSIYPVVYKYGSLGASGDLSPLSHMSLALIGEGEVEYNGKIIKTSEVLKKYFLKKINLQSKEGLALINGTQFMLSSLLNSLFDAYRLCYLSDKIACISLDAYNCDLSPFNNLISKIRPHKGQNDVSKRILNFLKDSHIQNSSKDDVQDPYSFRCIPQVHGATLDSVNYCSTVIETEINSVTDNPLIFPENNMIISGGNFHGQPLALVIDFLKISLSELGSISERRTFNLMSGKRNLPPFLTKKPGLNSGLMIIQYTAASLVSLNKQLSSPSSVDSIVSSNGQEDHVSMGANSAILLFDIVENVKKILSIELFNAAQALNLKKPLQSSESIQDFIGLYRTNVAFISEDKVMSKEINSSLDFFESYNVRESIFTF